jgi:hypothetical protein
MYTYVVCRHNSCVFIIQGVSNMTGTNCDLFTHKSFRSYLNHLVILPHFLNCFFLCRKEQSVTDNFIFSIFVYLYLFILFQLVH